MEEYNPYVPNVHYELIPIKNLVSDQLYQRSLSASHITKAVEHFDLYQINPVKVSRREGTNYVFNGQHTIEIVAAKSGSRDTPVWCMIYDDLNYEQEADIFANQMKFVKPLLPYEVFNANLEAGNPDQQMIKRIVESYGMEIGKAKSANTITAVSTIEAIYKKHGYHTLDQVMRMCIGTWEGESMSFSSNMLNAICLLVVAYGDLLDEQTFKNYLWQPEMPDVDLMIRTSGEQRLSNYMLYENAYAEFVFTNVKWPDFRRKAFVDCLKEYQNRNRRYGGLKNE